MANVTELRINGASKRIDADRERSLLFVLRNDLNLTGTKYGCGEGRCGACTVLLDGKPVRACVTTVSGAEGKEIRTIEGLEKDGRLHPLQTAFVEADAYQCGYCTPGMIMSALALVEKNPAPSDAEIHRHMNGNICRCGTYVRIAAAVRAAGQALKGGAQ
jgi:aerobic-type carbon monoxide dehydrogenase small subunit (CoxS/CutS family)